MAAPGHGAWRPWPHRRADAQAHAQVAGQLPLAVASVPLPTGITVTAEFSSSQLSISPEAPNKSYWLLVRALWPSGDPENPNIDVYHLGQIALYSHPASDANPSPPEPVIPFAPASVVALLAEQIADAAPQSALVAEINTRTDADAALQAQLNDKIPVADIGQTVAPVVDGQIPPAYLGTLILDGGYVIGGLFQPSKILDGGSVA